MNSGEFITSGFGFSDKKTGTLMLICELMDMNIYELIRGKFLVHNCVKISLTDLLNFIFIQFQINLVLQQTFQ